jgi:hypothetical protein
VTQPLVSTAVLTDPAHQVLLGETRLDYGTPSGGRITAGGWLDCAGHFGLEGSGFGLGQQTTQSAVASGPTGLPGFGIPFINVNTGQEDFAAFATPNATTGRIAITSSSRFWGAEGNGVYSLFRSRGYQLEALAGFRYLDLREDLRVDGSITPLDAQTVSFGGAPFVAPASISTSDRFITENRFYGGQVGLRTQFRLGNVLLGLTGKVALGATSEALSISGSSSLLNAPVGTVRSLPGGFFALPSNIGKTSLTEFAVVPEVAVRLGYKFGQHLSLFVGYDFLYLSHVARPGEQIDPRIFTPQVPTSRDFNPAARGGPPQANITSNDFWAQGLTLGVQFRY